MDLLYSKYASPISFIDSMLMMGTLLEGIKELYKRDNEDKMWELYLHSNPYIAPRESFDKWKEAIMAQSNHSQSLTKEEVKATVEKSQGILNNFKLKEGD